MFWLRRYILFLELSVCACLWVREKEEKEKIVFIPLFSPLSRHIFFNIECVPWDPYVKQDTCIWASYCYIKCLWKLKHCLLAHCGPDMAEVCQKLLTQHPTEDVIAFLLAIDRPQDDIGLITYVPSNMHLLCWTQCLLWTDSTRIIWHCLFLGSGWDPIEFTPTIPTKDANGHLSWRGFAGVFQQSRLRARISTVPPSTKVKYLI